jgi:hypothetical protein
MRGMGHNKHEETCIKHLDGKAERKRPLLRHIGIAAVLEEVDAVMLQRVWMELEYRLDVLRVTKGAHVEVL